MDASDQWSPEDVARANEAYARLDGFRRAWSAEADTTRAWEGGVPVLDEHVAIKNHAEYSGAETYAWQYLAFDDYASAADCFYLAAELRRENSAEVTGGDGGHAAAELLCLRLARWTDALEAARGRTAWPEAEDFGLDTSWVEGRIANRLRRGANALSRLGHPDIADEWRAVAQEFERG